MTLSLHTRRETLLGAAAIGVWATGQARAQTPRVARRAVRVTLLGQAMLEHDLRDQPWPDRARVAALVGRGEVNFSNLETVIKGAVVGAPTRELITLHAGEPVILDCLKDLNINLLATSNNHAFDLGVEGILSTIKALDEAGLPHAGTGVDLAAAAAPAYQTARSGAKVAVVGFATGKVREGGAATPARAGVNEVREDSPDVLNEEDLARVFNALQEAARNADVVIAYHHNHLWGADNAVTYPWQTVLARRCVDAGATTYVAHGAPMVHGMEVYRDAPMFYGLGNFIFQTETPVGNYPRRSWEGLIVDCQFKAAGRPSIGFTPLSLNEIGLAGPEDMHTRGRPSIASGADAARILADFAERSKAFGTRIMIQDGVAVLG